MLCKYNWFYLKWHLDKFSDSCVNFYSLKVNYGTFVSMNFVLLLTSFIRTKVLRKKCSPAGTLVPRNRSSFVRKFQLPLKWHLRNTFVIVVLFFVVNIAFMLVSTGHFQVCSGLGTVFFFWDLLLQEIFPSGSLLARHQTNAARSNSNSGPVCCSSTEV